MAPSPDRTAADDQPLQGCLSDLLAAVAGQKAAERLVRTVAIHPQLQAADRHLIHRSVLAEGLALLLFDDLLHRVPEAAAYIDDRVAAREPIIFDHGALRTVDWDAMGTLPRGETAITRLLGPLGYEMADVYPLDRLGMTGRAYRQKDLDEHIPQYFVSEFHVERFDVPFQEAVGRVVGSSRDPLPDWAIELLAQLERDAALPPSDAVALLPVLVACFDRQHPVPAWSDYEILKERSAEMAWIATEGNAFNHATDRVGDLEATAQAQKDLGRPMKDRIEVSGSGRVRQTAYKATTVERPFLDADEALILRSVPGSFYEFIERRPMSEGDNAPLDLAFDSSNAQGIFKMTAGEARP